MSDKSKQAGLFGIPAAERLSAFSMAPDYARIALPTVCALYDASPATVWRRVKAGLIPAPRKEGGSTRWIVGELRAALEAYDDAR